MSGPPAEPATESPASRRPCRPQIAPAEHLVSRGGRRAALFLARHANPDPRRILHEARDDAAAGRANQRRI